MFSTDDGGEHWRKLEGPPAREKEGGFAASGTCLVVTGARDAWFATTAARVFHSTDGGATWTVVETPVRHDKPSAGIFSLAISSGGAGVAVGGDYASDKEDGRNIAITNDGGRTWTEPPSRPSGFRSAAAFTPAGLIVTGTSGSDLSTDGGKSWKRFDGRRIQRDRLPVGGRTQGRDREVHGAVIYAFHHSAWRMSSQTAGFMRGCMCCLKSDGQFDWSA